MKCRYTLYKNPIQTDTLAIVQYLYHNDIFMLPTVIIEKNHPHGIELPAIYDHLCNELYEGIDECVRFYETYTGMTGTLDAALAFKAAHPDFHIY